jgi:hypothetical protein
VRKADLLREIAKRAKAATTPWGLIRQGAEHERWRCGKTSISVPRHNELTDGVVDRIRKDLEQEFGEDWWRRGK